MLEAGAEERLLRRAVALGVLREEDVPALPDLPDPGATRDSSWRFGPRLDHLLRLGKLAEGDIHRLTAEASAFEQTVDGTFPPSGAESGSAQSGSAGATDAEALPLARTLQSDVLGGAGRPVVSVITFPAPHWDRYEFLSVLGRGGMGAVYRARDRRLGRTVALKFILSGDEGTAQRFMQEARAQSRLDHPCICRVFEVGIIDQKPYIALELIEGTTLDRANLTLEEKVRVFRDAADAVHYAHEQGIIHRDIKPSEVAGSIPRRWGGPLDGLRTGSESGRRIRHRAVTGRHRIARTAERTTGRPSGGGQRSLCPSLAAPSARRSVRAADSLG